MEYNVLKDKMQEISSIVSKFPESVQEKVFDLLISSLIKPDDKNNFKASAPKSPARKKTKKESAPKSKRTSTKKKDSFTLLKDLDLTGKAVNDESFADFIKHKKFKSHVQFITISVYYLEKIMNLENITIDHVFTCYKNISKRPPDNLIQAFKDASGKRFGYIDFSNRENITIPHIGETHVENDWEIGDDK